VPHGSQGGGGHAVEQPIPEIVIMINGGKNYDGAREEGVMKKNPLSDPPAPASTRARPHGPLIDFWVYRCMMCIVLSWNRKRPPL